jgi:hypothetical protein
MAFAHFIGISSYRIVVQNRLSGGEIDDWAFTDLELEW